MKTKFLIITITALSVMVSFGIFSADAYHDDRTSRGSDDPKIASIGDTAYVVWEESTDPQFWDVYFRKITNGTLHGPINLTNGTSFYPTVQVSVSENNVYVLWEDRQSPEDNDAVYFTKSNDSGKTFDEPRKLAPANGDQTIYRPFGMETSNDTLYIFASNWNRDTQQNRIYITSTDFGDTFSEPIALFNHKQSDQGISVEVYDDTIYILSDDRNDFDEKGSLYLRKILPDGTLTDIVNVNGGKTTVTYPQFAVFGENVYVSWRDRVFGTVNDRIHERWYPAFTKSHDGGISFDKPIILDSDPKAIDTVNVQGDYVFATNDSVYVLWRSEYWDGENQSFKIWGATSNNLGDDFDVMAHPMNELISKHGTVLSFQEGQNLYSMALTTKNPPENDAAAYFATKNSDNSYSEPLDIFSDVSVQSGMPDINIDENNIHFVADTRSNNNCILYSFSNDSGNTFSDVVNISPHGNDFDCLGILPEISAPLQQLNTGTDIQDVKCSQEISKGYLLVLKATDQMSACITADSYDELKKRGWILENYDEILALHTAREFVLSSPTFSFDGIEDTLKLDVLHARKSIPAVVTITGEFQTSYPGYGDRSGQEFPHEEKPTTHNLEMVMVQNNKVHTAVIDGTWNEITQQRTDLPRPEHLRSVHSGPTVSTTITIGEVMNSRGLVPVIITEKSENVSGSITFWQFQPIGYHGDNRGETWDIPPKDMRVGWVFSDEHGNTDVWDDSVVPSNMFGIPADLHGYTMFCDEKRIGGESAHPSGIPIKPEFKTTYAKSGSKAILPDSDGVYTVQFATLFETTVELPDGTEIIENKTTLCKMPESREDATHGYYTKLVFKLDGNYIAPTKIPKIPLPDSLDVPSEPYEGAILGDEHEHASILVKIFGDKFDFSLPEFQIKSSWIHFEAQDGNTIHRHSKDVTLGYLFDTINIGLSSKCYVFHDGHSFCTNEDYSLKFYLNGEKVDDIRNYVISDGDRILVSYGSESPEEIAKQLEELNRQEIRP